MLIDFSVPIRAARGAVARGAVTQALSSTVDSCATAVHHVWTDSHEVEQPVHSTFVLTVNDQPRKPSRFGDHRFSRPSQTTDASPAPVPLCNAHSHGLHPTIVSRAAKRHSQSSVREEFVRAETCLNYLPSLRIRSVCSRRA
eukprot:474009-Prymnesium_polylepis.1